MQEVTMYQTSDGQKFEQLADANKHEASLKNAGRVQAFLDAKYPLAEEGKKQGPSRSIAKKAVEQFLEGEF
jgi:hypothetical protein